MRQNHLRDQRKAVSRQRAQEDFQRQAFVKHGVEVWNIREGQQRIDRHTDKLINYIRFWQAAGESEKIAERVATRIRQINTSGHYSGGTVPYGYRIVNKGRVNKKGQPVKDLEIDQEETEVVRELFVRTADETQVQLLSARPAPAGMRRPGAVLS